MIHHRQRLPLRFKTRHHRARIHAQLDHLDSNSPVNGFLLLGHVNFTPPTFSQFLQDLVSSHLLLKPRSLPVNMSFIHIWMSGRRDYQGRAWSSASGSLLQCAARANGKSDPCRQLTAAV